MANSRRLSTSGRPLLMLGSVVALLYFAREIFIPLALALTLGFVLKPAVSAFQHLKLGRVPAVIIVMLLALGLTSGIGWMVGTQLLDVANDLPQYRYNIRAKITAFHSPSGGPIGKATQAVKEIGKELSDTAATVTGPVGAEKTSGARRGSAASPNPQAGRPVPVQVIEPPQTDLQYFRELLIPMMKPLGQTVVVLVFTVFILIKREDLRNRVLRLVGLGRLNVMTQALDDGAQRISRYLIMQFLVNASYGAVFGFGLFLIGLPHALLWGAMAGALRIIPYIGALAGAALPLVLALAVFDTWMPPVLVFILYLTLEGLLSNFLEPWLYGTHTGVSSLALLVTTVFWTVLWGWAGLILSTPLTVCVIVLGRYVPHLSFLHILLGDEAPLTPDAQFYQRLLAMDSAEAHTIFEDFLKNNQLVKLYDSVFVPALAMAEQDRHKGALDETREVFVFLSTGEFVAELAEYQPNRESEEGTALTLAPARAHSTRVISIPAHDQADEITATMLSQLLEKEGYSALTFPVNSAWDEALKPLSPGSDDVICIAALPPFAFTHARSACQRVRAISPDVRIIVGIWGFGGDTAKAKERFAHSRPDELLTTLSATLNQIAAWETPAEPASEESAALDPEEKSMV